MKKLVLCVELVAFVGCLCLAGCTGVPSGLEPITGFDLDRYLGQWYEVARLDHSFERDMSNVSAHYSRGEGEIRVVNRGFDERNGRTSKGEAISEIQRVGSLKVSFFGPFYGGYHIIALDKENYRYAMVAGPQRSYLWILSRDRNLDQSVLSDLVSKAKGWGFETDQIDLREA